MFPVSILIILIITAIGGSCILILQHKAVKEYENHINALAKNINGSIKRKKLFLFREFEIKGQYKGREIFCYTDAGSDVHLSFYPFLIIETMTKNAQKTKLPLLFFSSRLRKISENVSVDILTGHLRVYGTIDTLYRKDFIKLLDELTSTADRIESLNWNSFVK